MSGHINTIEGAGHRTTDSLVDTQQTRDVVGTKMGRSTGVEHNIAVCMKIDVLQKI
jgi:hypothetical protein